MVTTTKQIKKSRLVFLDHLVEIFCILCPFDMRFFLLNTHREWGRKKKVDPTNLLPILVLYDGISLRAKYSSLSLCEPTKRNEEEKEKTVSVEVLCEFAEKNVHEQVWQLCAPANWVFIIGQGWPTDLCVWAKIHNLLRLIFEYRPNYLGNLNCCCFISPME